MTKYIWLILLAVFSAVHLKDSYNDDAKKRARTKGLLVPMIIAYLIHSALERGSFGLSIILLLSGLIFSWLGDILLIPSGMKWLLAGGISFLFTHFLFIAIYIPHIILSEIKWYIVIPVALIYFAVAAKVVTTIKPFAPKMMRIPLFAYLIGNALMNTFAVTMLVSNPCRGSITAFIGALLFFISDSTLFFVRFHENKNIIFKRHFTVMLTYILAELMITLGILWM